MARKEVQGFNVPYYRDADSNKGRENKRGKGIWDIEGIGTPAPRDESSAGRGKKTKSLLGAILGASGVVGTDPHLLEIQRQEAQQRAQKKAAAQSKKAQRKQGRQTSKQEIDDAKNKAVGGLFVTIIGAATSNPAMTAAGVGTTVDGMADTIKARKNRRARRKNPNYNPGSEKQGSSVISELFQAIIDLFKVVNFGQKKSSTSANQAPSPEPTMNGGFDMSNFDQDIIEGEFTVIDDGRPKQLTGGKKS